MEESNDRSTPGESLSEDLLPQATDAFTALGNETRLGILVALWDAYDPHGDQTPVSFSVLRDKVGIRQGAQFNYHLDKLVGTFIEKTEAGYSLRRPGLMLVQSIISGTTIEDPSFEPTEIDAPCPRCGAATTIDYDELNVYRICTECDGTGPESPHPAGTLTAWTFEPTGLGDRTAEEVYAASTIKTFARVALRFEDICPDCSGTVDWSMAACLDHDPDGNICQTCGRSEQILVRETCTVCKSRGWGTPGIKVLFHPAVISFCYDHGIEIGFPGTTDYTDVIQTLDLVEQFEETIVSTDPLEVELSLTLADETLTLRVDEEMTVLAINH